MTILAIKVKDLHDKDSKYDSISNQIILSNNNSESLFVSCKYCILFVILIN